MRLLKRRGDVHALPTQPRVHRLTVIRWLYIAGVLALAVWLVNFFFGGLFYLKSEGLVLSEPGIVAAEFTVTVRDILVRQGESVQKGKVAAIVSSQSVTESIARLTADIAAPETRRGELRIRSSVVNGLFALAQNRQNIASAALKELETLTLHGNLTSNQRTAAVDTEYRSYQDLEALKAEKPVLNDELRTLTAALTQAESAVDDLRKLYDGGQLRVSMDGVITRVVANKGSVTRAGDPIVELYGNQHFVLGYVPTGTLYRVAVGDEVQIKTGLQTLRGTITRVEPVAAALPREFQRSFAPVETQQLIRVEFAPGEAPPPLFTKVNLRSDNIIPRWVYRIWRKWTWVSSSDPKTLSATRAASMSGDGVTARMGLLLTLVWNLSAVSAPNAALKQSSSELRRRRWAALIVPGGWIRERASSGLCSCRSTSL
jgi:multidrug resistance efflux pump